MTRRRRRSCAKCDPARFRHLCPRGFSFRLNRGVSLPALAIARQPELTTLPTIGAHLVAAAQESA